MDFINKGLAQLNELFRSMTPAARITTALLLVVIIISGAYLFNHQFSGSDEYLFGGDMVPPAQLPAMMAAFGKAGLKEAEFDGNRIRVPRGRQADYMAALADAGALPHNFLDPLKKSLEVNFLTDKNQREEKVKVAVQEQLAEIVGRMTGIEWATVMYNVERSPGFDAKRVVTASVTVKPTGEQSLSDEVVQKIRLAVGPPIGAAPETVAVVDVNGHAYPGTAPGDTGDAGADKYLSMKLKHQQDYTYRIRNAISYISGALVSVDVELNHELNELNTSVKVDPKAVPVKQKDTNSTLESTSAQAGGRPGVASQLANAPLAVGGASGGTKTTDEKTMSQIENAVSTANRQVWLAGLTPKRVTASVAIPTTYYEEVWQRRNPTAPGGTPKKPDASALVTIETEVNAKIKSQLTNILPPPEDPAKEQVSVTSFQPPAPVVVEKPSSVDRALGWLTQHASSVGMGVLGMFSLLMVRSIVRAVPPSSSPAENPNEPDQPSPAMATSPVANVDEPIVPSGPSRLRRRRGKGGPSLRDELVEIVREDPDAAANILRSWIGSAN